MMSKGILLPYQKSWVEDRGRFKIGMWARQTGKSFATALEVVLSAIEGKELWVLLSKGERQSKELMQKVKMHLEAFKIAASSIKETYFEDTKIKQLEIELPNGSRIIGLPANPDTARGYSGNVVLDEFAFHKDSRAIWTALYPTITRGYKIRVISTPNGKQNKFYELWTADDHLWSKHKVTIYDAVRAGLHINIDELRAGISDPDAWAQEYECKFIDEATAFLTFELITWAESETATHDMPLEKLRDRELYLGMDIGRKRDLSVIWIAERVGDVLVTRVVKEMFRYPFAAQREILFNYLEVVRRAAIDATGLGMQLAEEASERFGYKVEPVTFTASIKEDLAYKTLIKFQDRLIRIPIDPKIRNDLHSVKKVVTAAGNIRFDAERTENSHADRFWALALAIHAAENRVYEFDYETIGHRQMAEIGEVY